MCLVPTEQAQPKESAEAPSDESFRPQEAFRLQKNDCQRSFARFRGLYVVVVCAMWMTHDASTRHKEKCGPIELPGE